MSALAERERPARLIEGGGTSERAWLGSGLFDRVPTLDVDTLAQRFKTIWVVAPHPGDEILGVGGLMARLARVGADARVISVTDGAASHPGSTTWSEARLIHARQLELRAALGALGLSIPIANLGIPDGQARHNQRRIEDGLSRLCGPDDLMLATWRLDGPPDHEACGEAAVAAAARCGATAMEYPVWAWHRASPAALAFPWERARRIDLDPEVRSRKAEAMARFESQIKWDDERAPVLPPNVLERFRRPFEVVFA